MMKVRYTYQRRLNSSVKVYDQNTLPYSKSCRVELRDSGSADEA